MLVRNFLLTSFSSLPIQAKVIIILGSIVTVALVIFLVIKESDAGIKKKIWYVILSLAIIASIILIFVLAVKTIGIVALIVIIIVLLMI